MFKTDPLVWAKDEEGRRYLCPLESLKDPNYVGAMEKSDCISDDISLKSRSTVPSNDDMGKVKFPHSVSLN